MPPLPPVTGVLKITKNYDVGADLHAVNILHWRYTGGAPSAADCVVIAQAINTAESALHDCFPTSTALESVNVLDLASNTGKDGTFTGAVNGTRSGTALLASTCTLVNLQIARRYRGGKPRVYLPGGVTTDLLDNQTWGSAFISHVNSQYGSYQTAVATATSGSTVLTTQCSVSYYSGFTVATDPVTGRARNIPKLRSGGPLVDDVVSFGTNKVVGTQRRRMRR